MRKLVTVLSKSIAVLFSILFISALVLILLLVNAQRILLNAETSKRLLVEHNVYEQLPAVIAEGSSSFERFLGNPCMDNPLVCANDGASPELQDCLRDSLGEEAYLEIGSGQREPTGVELQGSQPCIDQYEESEAPQVEPVTGSPEESLLSNTSAEVQVCARQALGDEVYDALYNAQRAPTKRENRQINACIRQTRRNARVNNPGIGGDLMPILNDFSKEQWEELIRILLPRADLREMTESVLDQSFAYLNGETDAVSISLVNLKTRLTGPASEELILFLLEAQPPCTDEQLAQIIAGNFENGGAAAIYCAVSGEALAKVIPPMQNRLDRVASQLPDEAPFIGPASVSETTRDAGPFSGDPLSAMRTIRYWMQLSPLLPLALLLLLTLFGVRSVKGWLRWWGIPIFIAGGIASSIGIAAQALLDWVWVNYGFSQIPLMISAGLGELSYALARSLMHEMGKWLMIESGLLILLGLAALIASAYVGPKPVGTARSFTPPELSPRQEVSEDIPPRTRDHTGYS